MNPIEIKILEEIDWELFVSFWDFEPSWQNSIPVMIQQRTDSNKTFAAYKGKELIGYIIYNPLSARIQQFAVKKCCRNQGVAHSLFAYIAKIYGSELSVVNVDAKSVAACSFLEKQGLINYIDQIEMKYYP